MKTKCWDWPGNVRSGGYGEIAVRHKGKNFKVAAHRAIYEAAYGPIPPGMEVMHKCDNPKCIRPRHLKLGTHLENMQDMYAKGRRIPHNSTKTHCKRNHEFTVDNTYIHPGTKWRGCKKCIRERAWIQESS